jgi:hypothetical protein
MPAMNLRQFIRYCWAEYPAWTYSVMIGSIGPLAVVTLVPLRRFLGYKPVNDPPSVYPCVHLSLLCKFICSLTILSSCHQSILFDFSSFAYFFLYR